MSDGYDPISDLRVQALRLAWKQANHATLEKGLENRLSKETISKEDFKSAFVFAMLALELDDDSAAALLDIKVSAKKSYECGQSAPSQENRRKFLEILQTETNKRIPDTAAALETLEKEIGKHDGPSVH